MVAQKLGLALVSPPDDLPKWVDRSWWKRDTEIIQLSKALNTSFPAFVKPLAPKEFRAQVYNSASELSAECKGLNATLGVFRSSIVDFEAEARAFVLDRVVLDCALYEGASVLEDARDFTQTFCQSNSLPATCVVDVGLLKGEGWAFVEANASWGSGLNGCDARSVLPAIERATRIAEQP